MVSGSLMKWLQVFLKFSLLVICCFFIYQKVNEESFIINDLKPTASFVVRVTIVFFLAILNWFLEAKRWQVALKPIEVLTLKRSWISVLQGQALNWILPFTSGDFIARLSELKRKQEGVAAVIFNRFFLMLITFVFGLFSFQYLEFYSFSPSMLGSSILLIMIIIVLVLRKKLKKYLFYFKKVQVRLVTQLFFLSIARYIVFVIQFYLLIIYFNPFLNLELVFAGIGFIFFVRTFLPALLGGAGLRESAAMIFFEGHVNNLSLVLWPVFVIWIINLVLPSAIGAFMLLKYRLVK